MKKVTCSQARLLTNEELININGGMRKSDAVQTAISGDKGCQVGARDTQKSKSSRSSSFGCGSRSSHSHDGGGRVICTYFYRKGMLEPSIWRADLAFTQQNLSLITVRGYHYWAIPYVRLMRKYSFYEKLAYPIAKYRAIELAYKMGMMKRGSIRGKIIRIIFEPACFMIGLFCSQKDWKKLWVES